MAALPEMELQCPAEEGYERLLIAGAEVGTLEEYNDLARYVVIKARYGLNPVRVRASIVGLTDNTCKLTIQGRGQDVWGTASKKVMERIVTAISNA